MKSSILSTLLALAPAALGCWPEAEGKEIKYSTVGGYFLQDESDTVPDTFDYVGSPSGIMAQKTPSKPSQC